mgnify:CR=1 FL=1
MKEEINKMFEGRWRIKKESLPIDSLKYANIAERVKALCRDFFEAGILLAQRDMVSSSVHAVPCEYPATDDEAFCTEFKTFWAAYDKKIGREKCEKLWAKLTIKEKKECLDYIPLYKQAQPDKQYRKNPETFLRNKSWNDELIFRTNAANIQPTIDQQRADKLASILTD